MGIPVLEFFGVDLVSFAVNFVNFYALYFALSLTLNLEAGMTGIPNFGKVLFVAAGAAVGGSFAGRFASYLCAQAAPSICTQGGDFITFNAAIVSQVNGYLASNVVVLIEIVGLSLLLAALVGAVLGYVVSYPAIRLREDYLGMLLLASAQFFQIFLRAWGPLVGGTQGIFVPDPYFYFSTLGIGFRDLAAAVVMSAFAILVYVYAERVGRSPLGRMLKSVRDNEAASRSLGKDDVAARRKILIIASALAAIAGALVTFSSGSVGADTWTRFAWTFWPWLIIIIGGMGNNLGVALGALFFTAVTKGLQQTQFYLQPYIPFDVNWLQYLILASLLVLVLMVRPDGILKEKPAPTLSRGKLAQFASLISGGSGGGGPGKPGRIRRLTGRIRRGRKEKQA